MNTYRLIISTPDGNMLDEQVISILVRGSEGDLAVLAGHAPFITYVKPCDCCIDLADGTERVGHLEGGLLSVSEMQTTLLSGSFKWK